MKRLFWSSMILTLAVGCGQNNPQPVASNSAAGAPAATASIDEPLPEGAVLVTLKLPEMT